MQSRMPWLVVGMLSLFLSRLAGAQDYQWTEIVIPGATVLQAWQINDAGQVALSTTDGRSGIFYGGGTFMTLPPPPQGHGPYAFGINNDGVITGFAFTDAETQQGFILHGSMYTFFSRPGWDNTAGRAIANSGLITGTSFSTDLSRYAGFIYDPDTDTFKDATPPGSTNTITQGMNSSGSSDGRRTYTSIMCPMRATRFNGWL